MTTALIRNLFLGIAAIPSIYYTIALFSCVRFFLAARAEADEKSGFEPPVSILKPVRGLDPDVYEILFCVGDTNDPVFPLLEQLIREFPERRIRILIGSGREAANDKVAKLVRLVDEASHEYLVICDSDVRVNSNYLHKIIAPLANPKIGAVTCFYVPTEDTTWVQHLQDVGMLSDFYPGILVAKQLDGVKFALGPTIGTTRTRLQAFGGYAFLENRPLPSLGNAADGAP